MKCIVRYSFEKRERKNRTEMRSSRERTPHIYTHMYAVQIKVVLSHETNKSMIDAMNGMRMKECNHYYL